MATTPTYGIRYRELADTPDIAAGTENIAEDVETELSRIDGVIAGLATANDWTAYTPSVQNIGSAAFSTQTGFWRRTWTKHVVYTVYLVVSTAGTGALNVGYKLPTVPYRASIRQIVGVGTRGDGGSLDQYTALVFAGGTDEWVDRLVKGDATLYVTGADLTLGEIFTFSGQYREA